MLTSAKLKGSEEQLTVTSACPFSSSVLSKRVKSSKGTSYYRTSIAQDYFQPSSTLSRVNQFTIYSLSYLSSLSNTFSPLYFSHALCHLFFIRFYGTIKLYYQSCLCSFSVCVYLQHCAFCAQCTVKPSSHLFFHTCSLCYYIKVTNFQVCCLTTFVKSSLPQPTYPPPTYICTKARTRYA